jgi:hypothetical protein
MIGPRSYLAYHNFIFPKISLAGLAACVAAYVAYEPAAGHSGGTWLGYFFGGLATAVILWLMWYGVRKRTYASASFSLQGWLSGHVYLGMSLLLLVPLHSGFQFGWNVHTLAYALLVGVVITGLFGIYFYAALPSFITRNRPGQKFEGLLQQVSDLDSECRRQADAMPDRVAEIVAGAVEETRIGGGFMRQFAGFEPQCATTLALKELQKVSQRGEFAGESRPRIMRLLELLTLKQAKLVRIRRDIRYRAMLDLWLVIHVPLAFATVAAVAIHIFVVFYYW